MIKKEPKEHHYIATLRYTSPHFTQINMDSLTFCTRSSGITGSRVLIIMCQ